MQNKSTFSLIVTMADTPPRPKKRKVEHNQKLVKEHMALFPCFHKSRRGETYAFCYVCSADISVAHGGKWDLQKHFKSKKHEPRGAVETQ